jgi:hypothetical protein
MRRLLTCRLRNRRYDERGAFAILFAALVVMLMVLSAFTVDLGQAYVSKRQLQTAADAGALAAAQVFKGQTGKCADLINDNALTTAAKAAADKWAEDNYSGVTGTPLTFTCNSVTSLTVGYGTSGTTSQVFGQLATGHSTITTARDAAATIGPVAAGNMRPWGVCSGVTNATGIVIFVPMKGGSAVTKKGVSVDGDSMCGGDGPPGGWWVLRCTGQSTNNNATQEAVEDGCPTTNYQAVPGQTSSMSPSQLSALLAAACPDKTENSTCLFSDNGNNFHNASDQWQDLVGETFTMPVICTKPTCNPMAVSGGGTHASYAIQQLATVELCGFKLMPRSASLYWPTTGPCANANPSGYTSNSVTDGGGLFVVIKDLSGGPVGYTMPEFTDSSLTK